MVNTFITHTHDPRFKLTVGTLDNRRLGKQRVEGRQIYTILYKVETFCLQGYFPPPKCGIHATHDEDAAEAYIERCTWYQTILPIARKIPNAKLGFSNHPAVKMWLGYRHALGLYINSCIIEWHERGFKNNILFLEEPQNLVMPWWANFEGLVRSHCAALLNKEVDRNEKKWYITNNHILKNARDFIYFGYCWVDSLSKDMIKRILAGYEPSPSEICGPITQGIISQ
jgi:hypothetical protein